MVDDSELECFSWKALKGRCFSRKALKGQETNKEQEVRISDRINFFQKKHAFPSLLHLLYLSTFVSNNCDNQKKLEKCQVSCMADFKFCSPTSFVKV